MSFLPQQRRPVTPKEYQNYVFAQSNDRERLMLQYQVFKPSFIAAIEKVLDEYGLAQRLQQVTATTTDAKGDAGSISNANKVRLMDVGCGEGLFLSEVAALLEARGLLAAADLNGVDLDSGAIATAREFSRVSKPPRPYLNFYVHDATRPFAAQLNLAMGNKLEFDFIMALALVEHLPDARPQVERLYDSLRPGGVIYLRDVVVAGADKDAEDGWLAPHPAMTPIYRHFFAYMQSKNPDVEVAKAQAGWLRERGAEMVQTTTLPFIAGGDSQTGMLMLRNWFMGLRNSSPALVKQGLISQAEVYQTIQTLFRELNASAKGRSVLVDTFARKPLN